MSLGEWIDEVVALHAKAKTALRVEAVHDLRVAIRRCRSLAQGLREVDDDDGAHRWKALSDAGRPLFQGLGDLRDAQVMKEHATRLLADDPALGLVVGAIDARIEAVKVHARAAVHGFDVDAWRAAGDGLDQRAHLLLVQRALFDHLALRRCYEAKELHQQAMRSKASTALHELRIGVKKLRYTLENFLPDAHEAVGKPLKKMQDLLGDIHDLDVLVMTLGSEHVRLHSDDRSRASSTVRAARDPLVGQYRTLTVEGSWTRVRSALAQGSSVPAAHEALIAKKASGRGYDAANARSVTRSALVLVHGFRSAVRAMKDARAAQLLSWACACAGVDGGGKFARKFVDDLPLAIGFSERDRTMLSLIARAAWGKAPSMDEARVVALPVRDRDVVIALGAVVHLAAAVRDSAPFVVRNGPDVITLDTSTAPPDPRVFAEARAPLEALVGKPLWWRTAPSSIASNRPRRQLKLRLRARPR